MKKLCNIFKGKYIWAIALAVILSTSSAYTLVDAFILPKSYVVIDNDQKNPVNNTDSQENTTEQQESQNSQDSQDLQNTQDSYGSQDTQDSQGSQDSQDSQTEPQVTDMSYKDNNISINIEKVAENGVIYYIADVQLSDISYLKTAFAYNTFGKNVTQPVSEIAEENQAIFAINGDYYGFRDSGLIIRNGELYRDEARSAPDNQALTINQDGDLETVTEGEVSGESLISSEIWQSFSFGPVLAKDGSLALTNTKVSSRENPRTAIGQIDELHYIFIVADGRSNESNGMTLSELAQAMIDRGAVTAYNLDGGGSSAMWFNGNIINNPTDGRHSGERSVSDIIYIGN